MASLVLDPVRLLDDISEVAPGQIRHFPGVLEPETNQRLGQATISVLNLDYISDGLSQAEFAPRPGRDKPPAEIEAIITEFTPIIPAETDRSVVRIRKFLGLGPEDEDVLHQDGPYEDLRLIMILAGSGRFKAQSSLAGQGNLQGIVPINGGDLLVINNACNKDERAPHFARTSSELWLFIYGVRVILDSTISTPT